jgi:hypothetical protein
VIKKIAPDLRQHGDSANELVLKLFIMLEAEAVYHAEFISASIGL